MSDAAPDKLSPSRLLYLGSALLATGTLGFYLIPGMISEKAEGPKIVNAFYCSAVTLTTVGYGDICPGEMTVVGQLFLVFFSLTSLGTFCGPVMDLAASWRSQVPASYSAVASTVLGGGIMVFAYIEGLSHSEAIYASVITGTTIGYGDFTPRSSFGKIAVALYAIMMVNGMAVLLEPGRNFLVQLCRVEDKTKAS